MAAMLITLAARTDGGHGAAGGPPFKNPVLTPDHPDPAVLGPLPNDGGFVLVSTPGDHDIMMYRSSDLQTWNAASPDGVGIFNAAPPAGPGHSVRLSPAEHWHYCDIWSPVVTLDP